MKPILVTGASGLFGGEVTRQLAAQGQPVRLFVRDAVRAPDLDGTADIVVGDYLDSAALAAAMSGVEKMILATCDEPEIVATRRTCWRSRSNAASTTSYAFRPTARQEKIFSSILVKKKIKKMTSQ